MKDWTRSRIIPWLCLLAAFAAGGVSANTEERLDRIERLLESSVLLDMDRNLQQLQQEFSELRGEVDVLQRQLEDVQRQQRELYQDLDTRIRELEQRGAAPGMPDEDGSGDDTATLPPPTPSVDEALENQASADGAADVVDSEEASDISAEDTADDAAVADYERAFGLLREGRYQAAGNAFSQVVEDHPDTQYAENARYWLGETYYVVRDFDAAMEQFEAVAADEDNGKRADAQLKIGFIHYEREDWDAAREALEEVRDEHAGSTVAALAEDRLDQMRNAGR